MESGLTWWSAGDGRAAPRVRMQHEPRCPVLGADEPRQGDCCSALPWWNAHSDTPASPSLAAARPRPRQQQQRPRRRRRRRHQQQQHTRRVLPRPSDTLNADVAGSAGRGAAAAARPWLGAPPHSSLLPGTKARPLGAGAAAARRCPRRRWPISGRRLAKTAGHRCDEPRADPDDVLVSTALSGGPV